jgi:hypothetical protein
LRTGQGRTPSPSARCVSDSGRLFELEVADLCKTLGFEVQGQTTLGKRLWGTSRKVDLTLGYPGRPFLGIECKMQRSRGSVEEKCVATLLDIKTWPIHGILVYHGPGFSRPMRGYLGRQEHAVRFDDLTKWLEKWKAT